MERRWSNDEISRLQRLRHRFLAFEDEASKIEGGYWGDQRDLDLYDATFAQRIGWKWDAVLGSLNHHPAFRDAKSVLDWGCGTGIAARSWLAHVEPGKVERVVFWDRDAAARDDASSRCQARHPTIEVGTFVDGSSFDLLLVSHVLDELVDDAVNDLLSVMNKARAVLWVEPGSRATSRALSSIRERLMSAFMVVAPCTHQASCGALGPGRDSDWCHFFASPPAEVFTDGRWIEFSKSLGIDLRSLPYAYLALVAKPCSEPCPSGARLLARPKPSRGKVDLTLCDETGLHDLDFLQRQDKKLYKDLCSSAPPPLLDYTEKDGRIMTLRPI